MNSTLPPDFCPYKGLQPYTEADRAFFFGRDRDREIIISNLYAAPVTVLYGASGVGKSSVLLAGVVPQLKQTPRLVTVLFRNWQDAGFVSQLKTEVLQAASAATGKTLDADASLPLDEFLAQVRRGVRWPIFFIFDQFEEYFLYHPPSPFAEAFESEFASSINRPDVKVNFLLSLREDGLSKLDRFQGRVPVLLSNMFRLKHLDRAAAAEAIRKPLEQYNRLLPEGQAPMDVEDALVAELLKDLTAGKVSLKQGAQEAQAVASKPGDVAESNIETPFLQMVLTRLWSQETASGSRLLRLQTFEELGRAEKIARTHLDKIMENLSEADRDAAASVLRYLVTPSGTKIAQEPGALASWAKLKEDEVQRILDRLNSSDVRILRAVEAPGQPVRYEIFHDVLAQAILFWRQRYDDQQKQRQIREEEEQRRRQELATSERQREAERTRRMHRTVIAMSILLAIMGGLLFFAFWQRSAAARAERDLRSLNAASAKLRQTIEANEHIQKGSIYSQSRKYTEAIQEFDKALALDSSNPTGYNLKGYALMKLRRQVAAEQQTAMLEEAIVNLKRSVEIDPSYIWGHYNLALAYWAHGDQQEGVAEVQKVLSIDPEFRDIIRGDGQFSAFKTLPEYQVLMNP